MRQRFLRSMDSLEAIFAFLDRFSDAEKLDPASAYALTLAVEEFFTNIIKYGRGTEGAVVIEASRHGAAVTVHLEERTPEPFDVTRPTQTQFEVPSTDRRPGGLGIHIAKEMLDGLSYDYSDGTSRITLTKLLEK
ncbi:MAG TPA: ATP-binding protein [Bacteroidota bacterium]|nr:ATP-binding protein [Bacteroidota bacterium]